MSWQKDILYATDTKLAMDTPAPWPDPMVGRQS